MSHRIELVTDVALGRLSLGVEAKPAVGLVYNLPPGKRNVRSWALPLVSPETVRGITDRMWTMAESIWGKEATDKARTAIAPENPLSMKIERPVQ